MHYNDFHVCLIRGAIRHSFTLFHRTPFNDLLSIDWFLLLISDICFLVMLTSSVLVVPEIKSRVIGGWVGVTSSSNCVILNLFDLTMVSLILGRNLMWFCSISDAFNLSKSSYMYWCMDICLVGYTRWKSLISEDCVQLYLLPVF